MISEDMSTVKSSPAHGTTAHGARARETQSRGFVVGVLILLLVPCLGQQAPRQNHEQNESSKSHNIVLIINSGSTNTPGYRLSVYASGRAEWFLFRRRNGPFCSSSNGKLPPELTQRLFSDLRSLMPLDKLPVAHCMKSISFGHTLQVTFEGVTSLDLSCAGNPTETDKLVKDLAEINTTLGISTNIPDLPRGCIDRY